YPWAITLTLLVIVVAIYGLWANHVGPFALAQTPKKAASLGCADPKILKQLTDVNPAPSQAAISKITHSYKEAPAMTINTNKLYCAGLNTNRGLIVIELDPKIAPKTVNNFVFLAQNHFYDGEVFHRVIQSGGSETGPFIIQAGNPSGMAAPDAKHPDG